MSDGSQRLGSTRQASQRTVQLGTTAVPAEQWKHFHKITPFTSAGALWLFLVYGAVSLAEELFQNGDLTSLLTHASSVVTSKILGIAVAVLLAITLTIIVFAFIIWRNKVYALADSGIHYRSGVLMKTHTHMRWDRVQSVEIQQKLFGRIFGFASVKIESAGNDDDLLLGLLTMRDAAALRRDVLTTVDHVRSGEFADAARSPLRVASDRYKQSCAEDAASGVQVDNEPLMLDVDDLERDALIYQLSTKRLLLANLLSFKFFFAFILVLAALVGGVTSAALDDGSGGIGIIGPFVVVAGGIWNFVSSLFGDYGTKLYISANGVRKRAGLTKLTTSTFPPQRIHAIHLRRRWLWKKFDWWSIDVVSAGWAGSTNTQELMKTFVPVATRSEMLQILWTLVPGLGSVNDAALLSESFDGCGTGEYFIGSPRASRRVNPIAWKSLGVAITPQTFITRKGRFGRKVNIVIQDHTQSLHLKAGPIQRKLHLATLKPDLVPGPASLPARHLDYSQAWELMLQENTIAREARAVGVSESLQQWKMRMGLSKEPAGILKENMCENSTTLQRGGEALDGE